MLTLLLLFMTGCAPVETNNPNPVDNGVDSDTATNVDSGIDSDTGEELVGGNCGGPEPLEGSFWECSTGSYGYAWPTAGAPANFDDCLTEGGWTYEISSDGKTVTLVNESDGRMLTCELDE